MRRDGQFYLIDAFFAAAIVFIGIGLLVADFASSPRGDQARAASIDMADLLFDTPLEDIRAPYVRVENPERFEGFLTPMGQVHVWLQEGCDAPPTSSCEAWSEELLFALIGDLLPAQHGVNITVHSPDDSFSIQRDDAPSQPVLLINTRRILYTSLIDASGEDVLLGPDLVEVRVWV